METVLVVAEKARGDEIKKMLAGSYAFLRAESEKEARMKILDFSPSLVIVDAALKSGNAKSIAVFAAEEGADTVLMLPDELSSHMADAMAKYGVFVSSMSREEFSVVIRTIRVLREKLRKAEEKNMKLLDRLRNEKLLTEAKCLLARNKGLSEAEAHAYIEKKAMNYRINLFDAAKSIVRELS